MKRALCAAALAACWLVFERDLPREHLEAGTALRMELEDLARAADLVFEGRVIAALPYRDEHRLVRTRYTVSVSRSFAGAPLGTRTFELPGGCLADGSGTVIAGMPRLELGEDALLFLSEESPNQLRMPVGLAQGKFTLVRDDAHRLGLVRDQAELVLVDAGTSATVPFPVQHVFAYEGVIERVQSAIAAKAKGR